MTVRLGRGGLGNKIRDDRYGGTAVLLNVTLAAGNILQHNVPLIRDG